MEPLKVFLPSDCDKKRLCFTEPMPYDEGRLVQEYVDGFTALCTPSILRLRRIGMENKVKAAYPPEMKGSGIETRVRLGVIVPTKGPVMIFVTRNGYNSPREIQAPFEGAAIAALKQWLFTPLLDDCVPREAVLPYVPFSFKPQK